KRSLLGDAIAHATLPGVCLAYLSTGSKEPYVLLLGAITTGWLGTLCVDWIRRFSPVKEDAAIGIVLSVFFGAGILLLTTIQSMGQASQAGLDKFLFGQTASLMKRDILILGGLAFFLCVVCFLAFKEFKLLCFDVEFARSIGLPVRLLETVLTTLVVAAIAIGLQMVGVVLMAALLITPAAAARQWTDNLTRMVWLSGLIGAFSGVAGSFISSLAPRMPTGPWMVVTFSILFGLSLILSPQRGYLTRLFRHTQTRTTIAAENILSTMYRYAEPNGRFLRPVSVRDILRYRSLTSVGALTVLRSLKRQGLVSETRGGWLLTELGIKSAENLLRRHRLWELYLTEQLNIPPHRVHRSADEVEHWITQDQEDQLVSLLDSPLRDPHEREIPQRKDE
ncbi:MAG: metal ABC transporter permease, partial [Candidatus Omnitrophica bacterium]|nr:metal ABC transporter permease [Candidatus Omnitrophota bacterium]